jgi:hypothetical protein
MRLYVNTRLHTSNRLTVTTVYQKAATKSTKGTNRFFKNYFVLLVPFVAKIYRIKNWGSLDSSVFRL